MFLLWWAESQQKVPHFIGVLAGEKCLLGECSCCGGLKVNRKYLILLVCLLVKSACLVNVLVVD